MSTECSLPPGVTSIDGVVGEVVDVVLVVVLSLHPLCTMISKMDETSVKSGEVKYEIPSMFGTEDISLSSVYRATFQLSHQDLHKTIVQSYLDYVPPKRQDVAIIQT